MLSFVAITDAIAICGLTSRPRTAAMAVRAPVCPSSNDGGSTSAWISSLRSAATNAGSLPKRTAAASPAGRWLAATMRLEIPFTAASESTMTTSMPRPMAVSTAAFTESSAGETIMPSTPRLMASCKAWICHCRSSDAVAGQIISAPVSRAAAATPARIAIDERSVSRRTTAIRSPRPSCRCEPSALEPSALEPSAFDPSAFEPSARVTIGTFLMRGVVVVSSFLPQPDSDRVAAAHRMTAAAVSGYGARACLIIDGSLPGCAKRYNTPHPGIVHHAVSCPFTAAVEIPTCVPELNAR